MKTARNFGIIALVALALTALPGGDATLAVVLTLLTLAFFTAIALLGYRLHRDNRMALDALAPRQRLVLYASIGLAFLTFTATRRLFGLEGLGILAWFALLALASYGVFWVYMRSQRYE